MPKVLHSQGTLKLAKYGVCVRNGYDGDSEIVSELARHTSLKRWIATELLLAVDMQNTDSADSLYNATNHCYELSRIM